MTVELLPVASSLLALTTYVCREGSWMGVSPTHVGLPSPLKLLANPLKSVQEVSLFLLSTLLDHIFAGVVILSLSLLLQLVCVIHRDWSSW